MSRIGNEFSVRERERENRFLLFAIYIFRFCPSHGNAMVGWAGKN